MALPGADRAVVEPRKLRDYLLAPGHPIGRFKAAFFAGLGYTQENWGALSAALRQLAAEGASGPGETTSFGQKFKVTGLLTGPAGKTAEVVSVWIILSGEEVPRFVTAFPGGKP